MYIANIYYLKYLIFKNFLKSPKSSFKMTPNEKKKTIFQI